MTSQRKKKPFLAIKNIIFQSLKKRIFPKGFTHVFGQKIPIFLFRQILVKIRLEIMLSDFPQEKRNLFDYKKTEYSKVQKIAFFFSDGLIQALDQKMPNSSLFRFGHNKTRYNASRLCREKRNLF